MKEVLDVIKVYDITPEYIVAKAVVQVSTANDLPTANEIIGNVKCGYGSSAQAIQEGAFYAMDEDGSWYVSGH